MLFVVVYYTIFSVALIRYAAQKTPLCIFRIPAPVFDLWGC
jgi:hypothetical protein